MSKAEIREGDHTKIIYNLVTLSHAVIGCFHLNFIISIIFFFKDKGATVWRSNFPVGGPTRILF